MATGDTGSGGKGSVASNAAAFLGREAGRMPLVAVTLGLKVWEQSRPIRDMALRRGNELLQIAGHTPLGRFLPQPILHDDEHVDLEAERIAADARVAAAKASVINTVRSEAPAAPAQPAPEAVEVGAPGAVTDVVEKVSEQLQIDEPTKAADLPIPDFDNVSLGSLRARLRSLSVEDLVTLREWEKAHADRLPVVTLLDNRIAKVSAAGS